jgi:hypothetical protein
MHQACHGAAVRNPFFTPSGYNLSGIIIRSQNPEAGKRKDRKRFGFDFFEEKSKLIKACVSSILNS